MIRFTLGERRSAGRGGLGSIKHRPGRGNDAIPRAAQYAMGHPVRRSMQPEVPMSAEATNPALLGGVAVTGGQQPLLFVEVA
ncbi:hypothetical protein ACWD4T_38520, partial [Streptomyces umbrinus]